MSSGHEIEKRYVAIHKGFLEKGGPMSIEVVSSDPRRLKCWGDDYAVYELGPEVTEPDYEPLVEWMRQHWIVATTHTTTCAANQQAPNSCDCGRNDALKAAGIA